MKAPARVLLIGAAGRMGKTIVDLAERDPNVEIVAQCDLGDAIDPAMKTCDDPSQFAGVRVPQPVRVHALQDPGAAGQAREQP